MDSEYKAYSRTILYQQFICACALPSLIYFVAATGYLLEPSDYHVPDTCTCGVIKQWQFYAKGSGAIQLQVWKRLASNSYILMGENYYTVPRKCYRYATSWSVCKSCSLSEEIFVCKNGAQVTSVIYFYKSILCVNLSSDHKHMSMQD